ncbi:BH3 interacting domain death agonist isoform X1 [Conger conger]|nr:BH3 interacting domain death agonist isoform X1 [Conger conger]
MDGGEEAMDGGVEFDDIIPLVFVSFLQHKPCKNDQLAHQLDVLAQDLKLPRRDINCNGLAEEDGDLQTDGHHCCSTTDLVAGLEPMVAFAEDPAMLRNLAAELINIADQMEHRVVSQAAQNLSRKLQNSLQQDWKKHLSAEVDWALKQGVGVGSGLEQLPHERVLLALTMTLVKGACERVPHLLKGLFSAALQYMSPVRPR